MCSEIYPFDGGAGGGAVDCAADLRGGGALLMVELWIVLPIVGMKKW